MADTNQTPQIWTSTQAYVLAVICLLVGGAIGYLLRGSTGAQTAATEVPAVQQQAPAGGMGGMGGGQMPTPEQMKQMADKQAAPLLERLKATPNDSSLLAQVGNMYYDAQVFPVAIDYYQKALASDPNNEGIRTDMGTAYFYSGDGDRAIQELDKVLKANPKYANALFNRGMVKWKAKMDTTGAVADWETLLKTNPNYENKEQVETFIAQAKKHMNMKPGEKTTKPIN